MRKRGFEIVRGVLPAEGALGVGKACVEEMGRRAHMAHSDAIWALRTHPAVLREFRRLWGEADLVTGFDGIGMSHGDFSLPWHVDQTRPGRVGIQSIMALSVHDEATGGLQLLEGSHLHHSALVSAGADGTDWEYCEVDKRHVTNGCLKGCKIVTPRLAPGDMCFWDSRTVHRVVRGTGEECRLTAYLSFEPRTNLPVWVSVKRRRAVERGVATTHWASRCVARNDAGDSPPSPLTWAMQRLV